MRDLQLILPLLAAYGNKLFAAALVPHRLEESALLQMSAGTMDARDLADLDAEQGGLPADSLGRTRSFLDRVAKTRNQAKQEAQADAKMMSDITKNLTQAWLGDMQATVKRSIERPLTGANKRIEQQRKGLLKVGHRAMTGIAKWAGENIQHHGLSYKLMRWIQIEGDKIEKETKKWMRENIDWEKLAQSTLMAVSSHTGLKTTEGAQPHIKEALESLDQQGGAAGVRGKVQEWMKEGSGERTMADFMRFVRDMSEKTANMAKQWFDNSMRLQTLAMGSLATLGGEEPTSHTATETNPADPIDPDFLQDFTRVMMGPLEELEELQKLDNMEKSTVQVPTSAPTSDVQTWMTKYIQPGQQLSTTASEIKHLGDKIATTAREWFQKNMEWQKTLGRSLDSLTRHANEPIGQANLLAIEGMHPDVMDHRENAARMAHQWFDTMTEWQKLATGTLAKAAAAAAQD